MPVSDYEVTIQQTLTALGWYWCHNRPIFDGNRKQWTTSTTAVGWPDLIALHPRSRVTLACEVKGRKDGKGQPTVAQREWLHRFHLMPATAAVVFRPTDDWVQVAAWLQLPGSIPSGYGWLPEEEWTPVFQR